MTKRPFESNKKLPLAKKPKTENESQLQFSNLPLEILTMILEKLSATTIAQMRYISKQFNNLIMGKHAPRSQDLNNYLDLYSNARQTPAPTLSTYFEKLNIFREDFLEKQLLEIEAVQDEIIKRGEIGVASCRTSINHILAIKEKANNHAEVMEREALLDDVTMNLIRKKLLLDNRH